MSLGILLVSIGSMLVPYWLGWLILILGVLIITLSLRCFTRSFINIFLPQRERELVDIVYEKRHLGRGRRIVVLGGGTGLAALLSGIKKYSSNITAIVTVTDDGGSSGRLRKEYDTLPPGDIRNCLVALADAGPLMQELFQFRFKGEGEVVGHNFGNLFITALSKITGDFEEAIKQSSKVLAIRGKVLPASIEPVRLIAHLKDGTKVIGETNIAQAASPISRIELEPADCQPVQDSIDEISQADAIILGPGSLYTSVIPNILIKPIARALAESKAVKIYVSNVMTQAGETNGFTASQHLKALFDHAGAQLVDYCVINTTPIPKGLLLKYKGEDAHPVKNDIEEIKALGALPVKGDILNTEDYVRHDSEKLAGLVMDLINSRNNQ